MATYTLEERVTVTVIVPVSIIGSGFSITCTAIWSIGFSKMHPSPLLENSMLLNIFTWNMQRGRSILPRDTSPSTAKARLGVLNKLCEAHDVGFITEPGQDILRSMTGKNTPASILNRDLEGFLNRSELESNQQGINDCIPILYSKKQLKPAEVYYRSGARHAYRYPAAGVLRSAKDNDPPIMLLSLHATSGGGAVRNSGELLDHFDEGRRKRKGAEVLLIGGDMNFSHSHFLMPKKWPTHQNGGTLDGFIYEIYDDDSDINVITGPAKIANMGELIARSLGKIECYAYDPKGKRVKQPDDYSSKQLGYYARGDESSPLVRVSDHAPVTLRISFDYIDEFDDFSDRD